jgi:hypothetical protein
MQLSDHCQKYEERIRVLEERGRQLESEHMLKGKSAGEIEVKCRDLQGEVGRLN